MKSKFAIIGPYPSPYGGISVHIQRVVSQLDNINSMSYDFYNETRGSSYQGKYYSFYGKLGKILALIRLFFTQYTLIHHHSPDIKVRIILGVYGMMGKKVFLHIHGASLKDSLESGGIKGWLLKKLISKVHILADNIEIAELAKINSAKSVTLLDAFIPPLYKEEELIDFRERYPIKSDKYD